LPPNIPSLIMNMMLLLLVLVVLVFVRPLVLQKPV
jgi:hypothetical protein